MGRVGEFLDQIEQARLQNPTVTEMLGQSMERFKNKNEDVDGSSDSGGDGGD